jgi:hypothetical protein
MGAEVQNTREVERVRNNVRGGGKGREASQSFMRSTTMATRNYRHVTAALFIVASSLLKPKLMSSLS